MRTGPASRPPTAMPPPMPPAATSDPTPAGGLPPSRANPAEFSRCAQGAQASGARNAHNHNIASPFDTDLPLTLSTCLMRFGPCLAGLSAFNRPGSAINAATQTCLCLALKQTTAEQGTSKACFAALFFRSVESLKPNEGRAKELTPCLRRGRPPLCAVQPGAISLGVLLVSLPP